MKRASEVPTEVDEKKPNLGMGEFKLDAKPWANEESGVQSFDEMREGVMKLLASLNERAEEVGGDAQQAEALQQLQQSNDKLASEKAALSDENQQLKAKKARLDSSIQEFRESLQEATEQQSAMADENARLKTKHEELKGQYEELLDTKEGVSELALEHKTAQLRGEMEQLRKEMEDKDLALGYANDELQGVKDRNKLMESTVVQKNNELMVLREQLQDATNRFQVLKDQKPCLVENEQLKAEIEERKREKAEQDKELSAVREELQMEKDKNREMEAKKAQKNKAVKNLREELQKAKKTIAEHEAAQVTAHVALFGADNAMGYLQAPPTASLNDASMDTLPPPINNNAAVVQQVPPPTAPLMDAASGAAAAAAATAAPQQAAAPSASAEKQEKTPEEREAVIRNHVFGCKKQRTTQHEPMPLDEVPEAAKALATAWEECGKAKKRLIRKALAKYELHCKPCSICRLNIDTMMEHLQSDDHVEMVKAAASESKNTRMFCKESFAAWTKVITE